LGITDFWYEPLAPLSDLTFWRDPITGRVVNRARPGSVAHVDPDLVQKYILDMAKKDNFEALIVAYMSAEEPARVCVGNHRAVAARTAKLDGYGRYVVRGATSVQLDRMMMVFNNRALGARVSKEQMLANGVFLMETHGIGAKDAAVDAGVPHTTLIQYVQRVEARKRARDVDENIDFLPVATQVYLVHLTNTVLFKAVVPAFRRANLLTGDRQKLFLTELLKAPSEAAGLAMIQARVESDPEWQPVVRNPRTFKGNQAPEAKPERTGRTHARPSPSNAISRKMVDLESSLRRYPRPGDAALYPGTADFQLVQRMALNLTNLLKPYL
jgi:hypothetical protein